MMPSSFFCLREEALMMGKSNDEGICLFCPRLEDIDISLISLLFSPRNTKASIFSWLFLASPLPAPSLVLVIMQFSPLYRSEKKHHYDVLFAPRLRPLWELRRKPARNFVQGVVLSYHSPVVGTHPGIVRVCTALDTRS